MDDMLQVLLSIAAAFGYALAAWPILRARGKLAQVAATCVAVAVMFCPLLIPAGRVGFRALAAFLCIELLFKMLDYGRQLRRRESETAGFGDYLRLLIPFPVLLVVFGQRKCRSPAALSLPAATRRQRDVLRVLFAAALVATGFVLVDVVSRLAVVQTCFPLDHAVKLVIFAVTIEALSQTLYGLERLAGFETAPIARSAVFSSTVAEFWCRYNTRVHTWFVLNVFRPAGGRHAPVRGVLITFFVSGVLHELGFAIATSRLDGYQFAFFMLQAPAVLASGPLIRVASRGGAVGKAVAHGLAILWMSVTSVLFFHGVNRVFPFFYASEPWLP